MMSDEDKYVDGLANKLTNVICTNTWPNPALYTSQA